MVESGWKKKSVGILTGEGFQLANPKRQTPGVSGPTDVHRAKTPADVRVYRERNRPCLANNKKLASHLFIRESTTVRQLDGSESGSERLIERFSLELTLRRGIRPLSFGRRFT